MQRDFLNALKEIDNFTTTENGAITLKSTQNALLDAFGSLGAMKDSAPNDIMDTFSKAFFYNKELAMRLLFYIRDVRGGQGMRRVFRICLRWLAINYPELVVKNLDNVLFFGRGDDYLCLFDTPVEQKMVECVRNTLEEDIDVYNAGGYPSMLAKWMPSENTSSAITRKYAKKFMKALGLSAKVYRKLLSKLRQRIGIVETLMSQNRWEEIQFDKLPSKASLIYTDAFVRHEQDRYIQYLKNLAKGNAKVNAGALFPVDIIHKVFKDFDMYSNTNSSNKLSKRYLYDAMWKALPNYFGDSEETGLCVVDTSGSMEGTPMEVAISLGMYCADKAKGPFKDHFITFSSQPKLQKIVGKDIVEKVQGMHSAGWGYNTNLEAVFDLILKTAIYNKLPQEDLPSKLYIISDMQFDSATGVYDWRCGKYETHTFMWSMEEKFRRAGYSLPNIVYWNVRQSDCGMFQDTFQGKNCCMVSGYSPSLFRDVIAGTEYVETVNEDGKKVVEEKLDPITIMMTALNNERYDRVVC